MGNTTGQNYKQNVTKLRAYVDFYNSIPDINSSKPLRIAYYIIAYNKNYLKTMLFPHNLKLLSKLQF